MSKAHDDLEKKPEEKVTELMRINKLLEQENAEKRLAEEALKKREQELEATTKSLEELNAALKVLLKHREDDKNEVGEGDPNVKELIMPYLEKTQDHLQRDLDDSRTS